ncbi:MAG: hypothetical protein ACPLRS_05965 [Hydrogenobacter sp.]
MLKGANLLNFVFASQMGGYAMVLLDEVYAKWFGLFGLFPGLKNPTWFIHHQLDATLFAIPLALLWKLLPGPGIIKGLIYGVFWHILVIVISLVGAFGGAEWFQRPMTMTAQISTFILHLVWGGLTGLLYSPEER